MKLIYSRVTPFGFIDPATATDEDRFYGEEVEVENTGILKTAEYLRGLFAESATIQTRGFGSQEQAKDMEALLRGLGE
jgi:hypothetical protein